MTKAEIEKLAGIDVGDDYEILRVGPRDLLTPLNYVDILAKYIYAEARRRGTITPWVSDLYTKHLLVHNKLFDGQERIGAGSFIKSFNDLLVSVEKEGFLPEKSIIPVTPELTLLDGSHRVAAALVYGGNVTAVKTRSTHGWSPGWIAEDFGKRGLKMEFLDYIALQLCKTKPSLRLAIIFPLVKERYAEVKEIVSGCKIYYEKEAYLNLRGIGNLIAQMYKSKEWLNDRTRDRHAIRRFAEGEPVRMMVLEPSNIEDLVSTKAKVRELLNKETLPIHTLDDHEETVRVAEQILNENSIHFLNNADPLKFKRFLELFERYKNWIAENGYNKDEFCVDGGAVLAAFGLRECTDIDYLSFRNIEAKISGIDSHNRFSFLYEKSLQELLFDPSNYFYYDGYKFLIPERIIEMKRRRNDPQDDRDIELLRGLSGSISGYKKLAPRITLANIWNYSVIYGSHFLWRLYVLLPRSARPAALKVYHLIKKVYQFIRRLVWRY